MSVDLDRQLQEYARHMDEKQGALAFDDIMERAGELQVVRGPIDQPLSARRRWIAAAAAALAVIVVAVGTQLLSSMDSTLEPVVRPTTTTVIRSDFPASGPIEPGTYHLPASAWWSVADVTLTMPEGWETQYGAFHAIKSSASGSDGEVGFYFVIVDTIFSDPCVGSAGDEGGERMEVGPSVDDLAQALLDQPYTVAAGPVDTTLGGLPAKRVNLTMEDDPETATCNVDVPGNLQIWHTEPEDWFVLFGDGTASVYILEVDGERQVFYTQYRAGAPAEDINELQEIIESIRFDTSN